MQCLHPEITDAILRGAIAVHRELGPGLHERAYQRAMAIELRSLRIRFVEEKTIAARYRGVVVGWHRPDFIVEDKVVVEIKAATGFDPAHTKQVLTYLKLTKLRVGLLLNFGVSSLGSAGIKRFQL